MSTFGLGAMGGLGWGGLLADLVLVPHADAMLVAVPDHIDATAIASASDNIPDAWRCVGPQLAADRRGGARRRRRRRAELDRLVRRRPRGRGRRVACRVPRSRCDATQIAASLGAEAIEAREFPRKVGAFAITVDASGTESGLRCALESTAFDGWCTSPSVYLQDPSLPMFSMYSRCCTLHTGRVHARPAIPAVLAAVDAGFDPRKVTSTVVDWDDAESASPSHR